MLADHMTGVSVSVPVGDRPGVADDRWGTGPNPNPSRVDQPVSS